MQANSAEIEADTGLSAGRYDRRTRAFRQVRTTMAALVEEAGGRHNLTGAQLARIERAAQLKVIAAEARARALRDPHPDNLNASVRIENASERALRAIAPVLKRDSAGGGLARYLAEKAAP